jgi:hypothetical protein
MDQVIDDSSSNAVELCSLLHQWILEVKLLARKRLMAEQQRLNWKLVLLREKLRRLALVLCLPVLVSSLPFVHLNFEFKRLCASWKD